MIYVLTKPEWRETNTSAIRYLTDKEIPRSLAYLYTFDILAGDSETEGLDPHKHRLFCIQLGNMDSEGNPLHQFIFDMRYCPVKWVKPFLEEKCIVGVNLKFDLKMWYHIGIRPTRVVDLMLNEINITNGLYNIRDVKGMFGFKGLSINYLAKTKEEKKQMEEDIDKSVGKSFIYKGYDTPLDTREILYSAQDVVNPLKILPLQQVLINEKELQAVCDLENNTVMALADMEYNGIGIDLEGLDDIKAIIKEEEIKAVQALEDYLWASPYRDRVITITKEVPERVGKKGSREGKVTSLARTKTTKKDLFYSYETEVGPKRVCNVKWSSNEQVKPVFDLFSVPAISLDKEKLLMWQESYPIVKLFLNYGKFKALREKFMDVLPKYINNETGNIHTEYWQIVSTGRISASKPGLQQVPSKGEEAKTIRKCFVAPEGEVLVTSDLSNAELRVITELSQDPVWLDAMRNDVDLHAQVATMVFGITEEEARLPFPPKPDMTYRDVCKILNFSICYGVTEHKLSSTINSSKAEAAQIIKDYLAKVPKVSSFLQDSAKNVLTKGASYTAYPIHRPRFYNLNALDGLSKHNREKLLASYERAAMNGPIQG